MFRFMFDVIGTAWEIETPSPLEMPPRRRIHERIERFDVTYSRFSSSTHKGFNAALRQIKDQAAR